MADNARIDKLKDAKARVGDAISKVNSTIDAMRGRHDEASRRRRAQANAALEKLRTQKEEISRRIGQEEKRGDGDGSELKQLRAMLSQVQEQQKARSTALSEQVSAVRERLNSVTEGNRPLENLVAKERLSMRIKFNERVLGMIDNAVQRKELSSKIADQRRTYAKWEQDLEDAMEDAKEVHGDSDQAKDAERRAAEIADKVSAKEKKMDELHDRLEKSDGKDRESLQREIDELGKELDKLYDEAPPRASKKDEPKKEDKPKEDPKKEDKPKDEDDAPSVPDLPEDADEKAVKMHAEVKELVKELAGIDRKHNADQYGVLKVVLRNKLADLRKHLGK